MTDSKNSLTQKGKTIKFKFELNEHRKWNNITTRTATSLGFVKYENYRPNEYPTLNYKVKYISKDFYEIGNELETGSI